MYFHNIVGTGSYITSTTNMYQKDRFHVRGVRLQNVALKVPQLRHQIQQFWAVARDAVIKPVLPRRGGRSGAVGNPVWDGGFGGGGAAAGSLRGD